ncbi:MAG: hypothetical protein DMF63_07985 [Acidobacteria bacterium]|nr:MAG: hypothetical protein DMF63_07985 [Acidobacteriota bacterium]
MWLPTHPLTADPQMTSQNNLDLKGDFQKHPFAELLVEIVHAGLSGSLRLSSAKQKCVIYFREGAVVYGVSNAREHRLFSVLLTRHRTDEKTLAQFPNLANDLELVAGLEEKGVLTKAQLDEVVAIQIEGIIVDALTWPNGEWVFSPLARSREDFVFSIDIFKILIDYARCLPSQEVYKRVRSVGEAFYPESRSSSNVLLQDHERYALDCFRGSQMTIEQVLPTCSLGENALLQALYVLWLGGVLVRRDWNPAFSVTKIGEILTAKMSLVKSAERTAKKVEKIEEKIEEEPAEVQKLPVVQISVEDYLARSESAETLYDALGVDAKANLADLKNAYFSLAKMFHPDRFHREEVTKLRRIQVAFTQIAHAYDTLKSPESRENYDFKVQKQLRYREKVRATQQTESVSPQDRTAEHGLESFENAMESLNDEDFTSAAAYLARSVHYSPQNALYHAYFGHALSFLEKQHHKAEAALQTAVKLDPKNPKIRMMLVEFFIGMKLAKRAEGELKRFLEAVPGNKEAEKKLAELQAVSSSSV